MRDIYKILTTVFCVAFSVSAFSQITVTFTGRDSTNQYHIPLDHVTVFNLDQMWEEVLNYPDTILVLGTVGVGDPEQESDIQLMQNVPNPFDGTTEFALLLPEDKDVLLEIYDITGRLAVGQRFAALSAGTHLFQATLSSPQTYLLSAKVDKGQMTIKMVNEGHGAGNTIRHLGMTNTNGDFTLYLKDEKATGGYPFSEGDEMKYAGYAVIDEVIRESKTISREQRISEIIPLLFDVTVPTVNTGVPSSITDSTAFCGAHVTNNGGSEISVMGVCWSTSPDPTIGDDTLMVFGANNIFSGCIPSLIPNTTYHVRAFAMNGIGIAYGTDEMFTTLCNEVNLEITGNTTIDCGQSAILTATGADDYHWNTNDPTASVTVSPTATTTYTVTGTNSYGCTATETATVTVNALVPMVITNNVTGITATTATCGGSVTFDGCADVTARGVCWSTSTNPTVNDSCCTTPNGNGTGSFNSSITGLLPNTLYHVRAYAINSVDTAYGADSTFTTLCDTVIVTVAGNTTINYGQNTILTASGADSYVWSDGTTSAANNVSPVATATYSVTGTNTYGCTATASVTVTVNPIAPSVRTDNISGVTSTSATCGGTVIDNGGAPVTERGVCWGTSHNPTVNGYHQPLNSGGNSFSGIITNLTPNRTYHVRAYAINSAGTAYGADSTFTTLCNTVEVSVPDNITINYGQSTTLTASGADNYHWSTNATTASITVSPTVTTTYTVTGTNSYGCTATANVTVTVNFLAPTVITNDEVISITSTSATCGGSVTSDGGASVTNRGVCWSSTTTNPMISDSCTTNDGTGMGNFTSYITGLTRGTTYHVRAYATNSAGTSYGEPRTFTTHTTPTVTTASVMNITGYSATCGGNVTSDGGTSVTNRGVCWGVNPEPTIDGSHTNEVGGTGNFTSSITGLTPGTTYHVRAYAINSVGIAYGADSIFTTALLPAVITGKVTNVTAFTASCGGNVISDGGSSVTVRGICWSTSPNPVVSDSCTTTDGGGTGAFSSSITGLTPNTTYHVRAYATNSVDIAYGADSTFTTLCNTVNLVITDNMTIDCGQSATLTASGASSYRWNTNATTASITVSPTAATTYTVTGTNSYGCTATGTVTLTVNPTAHIVDTTACDSYYWHGTTYTESGTYTRHYTNANGCASVDTLHLTIYPLPETPVLTSTDNNSCIESNGTITVDAPLGYGYIYTLNNGLEQSNNTFSGLQSGIYIITVINDYGCSASATDTIISIGTTVSASASSNMPCVNGTLELFASTESSNISFEWTGPNNFSSSEQNPTILDVTQSNAGVYVVTVTEIATGCSNSSSINVSIKYPSFSDTAAVACNFFDWYEHTNITTSCNNLTHTFTNSAGCDSVVTLYLTIKAAPEMKIIPVPEYGLHPPYCPNIGVIHLEAVSAVDSSFVPNLTYQWTTSHSVNSLSVEDTADLWIVPDSCTYTYDAQVMVTDPYGCTANASILVPVEDQAPSYIGGSHFDTASVASGCVMTVTDFTQYVTPSTIDNVCWNFSSCVIWQEPPVGTAITEETPVCVYISTPCREDTTKILGKFKNIPAANSLPIPVFEVTPNHNCNAPYDGIIRLRGVPRGYTYSLYSNSVYLVETQTPELNAVSDTTTVVFDGLVGDQEYWVLIITDFGYETSFPVFVGEVITYPVFHGEVTTNPTTNCTGGNGKINIAAEPGYTYYVFDANGNEISYPYQNLTAGVYTIIKENDATLCSSPTMVTVNSSSSSLTFTVTPTSNTNCIEPYNGKLTFAKANVWFVVTDDSEDEVVYTGPGTTLNGLHAGSYSVFGTDTITGCTKTVNKNVTNNTQNPVASESSVNNTICDSGIAPFNGKVIVTINNYVSTKNYTVFLEDVDTVSNASEVTEFTGLNAGSYTYRVIDNFYCEYEGEVEVGQQELPDLQLTQTPNTVSVPTNDYPGNGTITVLPPYDDYESGNYAYAYYYAPVGLFVPGDILDGDNSNLTQTMSHLIDSAYFVIVSDLRTGCIVADTITVGYSPIGVVIDEKSCPAALTVTDHEGNEYATVQIGNQCWMRENLRTTTSPSTGTYLIPAASTGYTYTGKQARWYNNDSATYAPMKYGLLYNWNAAVDTFNTAYGETSVNTSSSYAMSVNFTGHRRGICPDGWHLPSDAEWTQLTNFVGSQSEYVCGDTNINIAKALASTEGWNTYGGTCVVGNDPSANNATGFGVVPAGDYWDDGFANAGIVAFLWSSTEYAGYSDGACTRYLNYIQSDVDRVGHYKYNGFSVRCLRDAGTAVIDSKSCPAAPTVTDHEGNVYATVQIGNQCWMRENLRTTTSPSTGTYIVNSEFTSGTNIAYTYTGKMARWYNNDSATYAPMNYGLLYNWNAAVDTFNTAYGETSVNTNSSYAVSVSFTGNHRGICPAGWHLPSDAEWTAMDTYVGSQSEYTCGGNSSYIAKALASTTGWNNSSDTCDVGYDQASNNATVFSAVPAGCGRSSFYGAGYYSYFWSSTQYNGNVAYFRYLRYYGADVYKNWNGITEENGYSVRCLRDAGIAVVDEKSCPAAPTVTDHEGNEYATVQIGNQCWMRDNLRTTTSPSTGTYLIPAAGIAGTFTGKQARYYYDSVIYAPLNYGLLYNWNAAMDTFNTTYGETSVSQSISNAISVNYAGYRRGICPAGWHLPSIAEWEVLRNYVCSQREYICGNDNSYIAMALASTDGWDTDTNSCTVGNNLTANNATGFSAVPAGCYFGQVSLFSGAGNYSYFMSSTECDNWRTYYCRLYCRHAYVEGFGGALTKYYGFSVRCLRDETGGGTAAVVDEKSCPAAPTVTDHEGNRYATVQIGNQCWMRDNLRTTTSPSTGTYLIPAVNANYTYTGKQARWYDNDSATYAPMNYGLLYNWNAAVDTFNTAYGETSVNTDYNNAVSVAFSAHRRGICPAGWHLPSDAEWNTMEATVSGSDWQTNYETTTGYRGNHAGKLAGGDNWTISTTSGAPGDYGNIDRNVSGFSAVPAGHCTGSSFNGAGIYANFWSATQNASSPYDAYRRYLRYDNAYVGRYYDYEYDGRSVRCLRDETGTAVIDEKSCPATPTVTDHEGNVYATVQIGTQCWMRDNLRTTTSPSTGTYLIPDTNVTYTYTGKQARWYDNDSATYAPMNYGLLYNWNAAVDTFNTAYGETSVNTDYNNAVSVAFSAHRRGICPAGWHLPSDAEWTQLTNYVSSQSEYTCSGNSSYIAKALASTEGWNTSTNSCAVGNNQGSNNATGFSAVPAGRCDGSSFNNAGGNAYFWSATQYASNPANAYGRNLTYPSASVTRYTNNRNDGRSVRCLRDAAVIDSKSCSATPTVTDHEGNVYATVQIGNQCWMRDNLRTTTSPSTGTYLIPASGTGYTFTGKQARWYNNDSATYAPQNYGLLYNWNAAVDTFNTAYGETSVNTDYNNAVPMTFTGHRRGICPAGWHLPSNAEWTQLTNFVDSQSEYTCGGSSSNIAKALASTTGWNTSSTTCEVGNNQGANNATGFSAVPAGYCNGSSFNYAGNYAIFWSSTQLYSYNAWFRYLGYDGAYVSSNYDCKNSGYSVRCLRDDNGGGGGTGSDTTQTSQHTISVSLTTDQWASETTWQVKDVSSNTVLASGGPYSNLSNAGTTVQNIPDITVDGTGCYVFTIKDSYHDGICCNYGNGSYSVSYDGMVMGSGGNTFSHASYFLNPTSSTCPSNEISLTSLDVNSNQIQNAYFTVSGNVTNNGLDPVTSYKVKYRVDNGSWTADYTESCNIASGDSSSFTHNVLTAIPTTGQHTLEVMVSEPNGVADILSDNTLTMSLLVSELPSGDAQPCPNATTVTDIDGHVYNTVKLGSQCWMASNLRTTRYADGTLIAQGSGNSTTTAYRYTPDNNEDYLPTYGYLYNWSAVMHGVNGSSANPSGVQGVCPNGWHVPSNAEWNQLTNYLTNEGGYTCGSVGNSIAKALASTTGWNCSSVTCAIGNTPINNNSTGFGVYASGYYNGGTVDMGVYSYLWSTTENSTNVITRGFCSEYAFVPQITNTPKQLGHPVRCLRD